MTAPSAKVILDSTGPDGGRLTTLQVTMHRFILPEFNTHRAFSRNGSSSRAIPLKKQIERVTSDPAFPLAWPKEQAGMQGGAAIDDPGELKQIWVNSLINTVRQVEALGNRGLHKSVSAWLLEPFMWQEMIVTADTWDNFFALRISDLAQPEIRVLAEAMKTAIEHSIPEPLSFGTWHLPYVAHADLEQIQHNYPDDWVPIAKRVSAARCARVSYLTHDKQEPSITKDLALAYRLANPGDDQFHASPFEHIATPARRSDIAAGEIEGNFHWFAQFRHELERSAREREWSIDAPAYSAD